MNVMTVLERIKSGERVLVTLPSREGCGKTYNLSDGTDASRAQFEKISPFLTPDDAGLLPDCEPQTYAWAG